MKHFTKGSAVYKCAVCGRSTRNTGVQSRGSETCPQCWDLAGIENEISDGHTTEDAAYGDVVRLLREIASKGGDIGAGWADTFSAACAEIGTDSELPETARKMWS